MMLHNIVQEVNNNVALDSKKFANFCTPFVLTNDLPVENTISVSFSANTEDISNVKIQSYEANFLGKGEVFYDKTEASFKNNKLHNKLFNPKSTQILPSQSNQFHYFTLSVSAARCLADAKVIANNNDSASPISPISPILISNSEERFPEVLNLSISSNFLESMNLPDESFSLNSLEMANLAGICLSEASTRAHSPSVTSDSVLISEASSDHLFEMINCLIEEAEVSKLAEKASILELTTKVKKENKIMPSKLNEIELENQIAVTSFINSKTIPKSLSEEEAIEEELEKSYSKKCNAPKRKFKPTLWEALERKLKEKNYYQRSKVKNAFSNKNTIEKLAKIGVYASIVGLAGIYATEAFAVDIEAAAKAGVRPLRNTVVWLEPYLLGFGGIAGAYFAEGDMKTKAVKTGIGVSALWALSSALLSWMPNVA